MLKGLKGSPLTHINKHSHSWPLLLPHCWSLTHKHPSTTEVPPPFFFHPPNPITTIKPLLPHNSPPPEKLALVTYPQFKSQHQHPTHRQPHCTYTLSIRLFPISVLFTRVQTHTHAVFSFIYTNTLGEGEEVNITLLSRMQKKFMLPLKRERGILCELRWAIILFSTQTKKKGVFLGTWLPPIFLLAATGVQQHLH